MELLGTSLYPWQVYLAVYVLGMFLIGLPIAILSLDVWRYPTLYPRIGKILFPDIAVFGNIGRRDLRQYHPEDIPPTMRWLRVDQVIMHDNSRSVLEKYKLVQMMLWPLRLTFIIIINLLFFIFTLFVKKSNGKVISR